MPHTELNQKLEAARAAYYAGEPIMSDAEYDVLEAELAGLSAQQGAAPSVLTTVGTDAPGRLPHVHPMRSIENKYSYEEVSEWAQKVGYPLTLSAKFDGVSCSLTYAEGKLVKAVTRGDGDAGESILPQVKASPLIPTVLSEPLSLEVRGELVVSRSTMLELNAEIELAGGKPFVSTRNLVAGTVKLKDLSEVEKRRVEFLPWEVLYAEPVELLYSHNATACGRILALADLGFDAPEITFVQDALELRSALQKWQTLLANPEPEIGMDGVVIKVDSIARRRELGYGSKFANFQVAWKAQNAKTETTLKEVVWQVGRQGRLTPVGIVEPVVLAGATIERVTLNNLTWIREMGLKIGSRVMLMRSGDVIPKIVEVLDA